MRYWDEEHPEWGADARAFATAWRNQPKWVVSRSLTSVGPNAILVGEDLEGAIRELQAGREGEIEVASPGLARSLTELGLIDEYRTRTPWCPAAASPIPRRPGRRSALPPAGGLAQM